MNTETQKRKKVRLTLFLYEEDKQQALILAVTAKTTVSQLFTNLINGEKRKNI